VDFDPGATTHNLSSNGDFDCFILKLDNNGNFLWAKSLGSTQYDQGESITLDASGNCYVTGTYQEIVDFDPGTETYDLTSNGAEDIFILKLNNSGDFNWAHTIGGSLSDVGYSIAAYAVDDLYLTGYFQSTVDFDIGPSTSNLSSNGNEAVFIEKFRQTTTYIPEEDPLMGIAVFPNPTQGIINVDLGSSRDVSIAVYSIGAQFLYKKIDINTSIYQFKLNAPNGIYFMEVSSPDEVRHYKIIVN